MKHYLLFLFIFLTAFTQAQSILDQSIRIGINQQPLAHALRIIGNAGHFTFSYNSTILDGDSLVTLPEQTTTVRGLLDRLFNGRLEYHENGRYLILLPATPKTPPRPDPNIPPPPAEAKHYIITGIILDEVTGEKIPDASVYDANRMIATLSKEDGSFVIKFRSSAEPGSLTISKEFYLDTTIRLPPAAGRQTSDGSRLTILLSPTFSTRPVTLSPQTTSTDTINIVVEADSAQIKAILKKDLVQVEMTGFGRLLLSSRLKMQSLNLKKLFIQRPVQVSLVPGLSTNGALNSQVTNKFSVNIIGGYSGGLDGVELGGVFNIDKRKMAGVQAAGVGNIAGDTVTGVQVAGVYNRALDSVKGVQAAGVVNVARNLKGVQLSGVVNLAHHTNGAQLGVINITRHLNGFQLGVINIADTSDGASLGLFNFVKHGGLHEIAFYADEFSPVNLAYRSGNKGLYTIFLIGMNPTKDRRSYYGGIGIGHRFPVTGSLAIDLEASSIHIAPVEWKNYSHNTWLQRLDLNFRWQTGKWLSFSAGPSVALYNPDRVYTIGGHTYQPVPYSTFTVSGNNIGWIGWHAAINFL